MPHPAHRGFFFIQLNFFWVSPVTDKDKAVPRILHVFNSSLSSLHFKGCALRSPASLTTAPGWCLCSSVMRAHIFPSSPSGLGWNTATGMVQLCSTWKPPWNEGSWWGVTRVGSHCEYFHRFSAENRNQICANKRQMFSKYIRHFT